ncbi:MAG: metallophosphoesterase family protein [Desulfurobacteriaceae bacterium]
MKVGIIADVHANIHALLEVVKELEKEEVDEVWCLGDVVGYGAFPNECLNWIRENCKHLVLGNHELALLNLVDLEVLNKYAAASLKWTKNVITDENLEFLMGRGIQVVTSDFHLVHDSPAFPGSMEYITNLKSAYYSLIRQAKPVCFFAHTHKPIVYKLEGGIPEVVRSPVVSIDKGRFLINPGSVGQPRDGRPDASFLILEDGTVYFRRVKYDIRSAAKSILKAGLPEYLAARLLLGV